MHFDAMILDGPNISTIRNLVTEPKGNHNHAFNMGQSLNHVVKNFTQKDSIFLKIFCLTK